MINLSLQSFHLHNFQAMNFIVFQITQYMNVSDYSIHQEFKVLDPQKIQSTRSLSTIFFHFLLSTFYILHSTLSIL